MKKTAFSSEGNRTPATSLEGKHDTISLQTMVVTKLRFELRFLDSKSNVLTNWTTKPM